MTLSEASRKVIDMALHNLRWNIADDFVFVVDTALAELAAMPQMPVLPWSDAPEEAQWGAADVDGTVSWFLDEPVLNRGTPYPGWFYVGSFRDGTKRVWPDACHIEIPLGIDWRLCKQRRPAATKEE